MRHEESNLQIHCVRWFGYAHPKYRGLLCAIPNGGARDQITGAILKAEGVVAGVADLILFVPNGSHPYLCIEMKTPKGRQSDAQKKWQKAVESVGAKYVICRSLDEFISQVNDYLYDR